MADTSIRQSNFELLRILSMAGVLINHTLQCLWNIQTPDITWENTGRIFLMNWAILAVNCFIMISGYFTIKLSWHSLVRYYLQCAFYMVLFAAVSAIINHAVTTQDLTRVVFAASEGDWFVRCHFALMLVSPLINKALDALPGKLLHIPLLLLIITDVYLGYMHQVKEVAPNGFELVNLATIYMIGNYISRAEIKRLPFGWMVIGMLVLMTGLHMVKMRFFPIAVIYSLHYNSPCVLVASILMFLWARTWRIQSTAVNWFAGGVFAVYLIHCNPYISPYYWQIMKYLRDITPAAVTPLAITAASAAFFCIFVLFDKLRAQIFKPFESKIAEQLTRLCPLS